MAFDAVFAGSLPVLTPTPLYAGVGAFPSLTAEGRLNDVYSFEGTLPSLTASANLVSTQEFTFAGSLRPLSAAGTATLVPGFNFSATLPKLSATGHIAVGRTYDFTGALPSLTAAGVFRGTGEYDFIGTMPGLSALGYATLSDGVAASTNAWCVNLFNGAHSRYTNFPDAGVSTQIEAYIQTGVTDFGQDTIKYVIDAQIAGRADGEMMVTTKVNESIERTENYFCTPDTTGAVRRTVKLAKNVKGQYWQFKVGNVSGCTFAIKSLEVSPIVGPRHT